MDPILTNQTFLIGPGGDYATMQAAFDDLGYVPVKTGVVITLRWKSGHVPTTGIRLIGGNYSHFIIEHQDASPGVDTNGVPLPQVTLTSFTAGTAMLYLDRAVGPRWNVLLSMNGFGGRGIEAVNTSVVNVLANKGILKATQTVDTAGLYLSGGCTGVARSSVFAYNGRGIWVARASGLDAEGANLDRCQSIGLYVSRSSTVSFADGKARNITTALGGSGAGVVSNRSSVSANTDSGLCDVSNCSRGFVSENGGVIDASGSSAQNCAIRGASAEGGQIVCDVTDCSGSTVGFYVSKGGTISRYGGSGSNSQTKNVNTASGVIFSNI